MTTRRLRAASGAVLGTLGVVVLVLGGAPAFAATATVGLGTAEAFAVLAASTVTNTGPTLVSGELGVSPQSAVTGFPPGIVTNGTIHSADAQAAQAQADLTTAYSDAASRPVTTTVTADLGGQTLVSGVYGASSLTLTGQLTLDGQNDSAAVFIFKSGDTLTTASASSVRLINGASPCSVFWQVGSSATLGTNSTFVGTVMAQASVTATTGVRVSGRLLARSAAVTLDSNTVTRPSCSGVVVPTATTNPNPTGTVSPTTGPTATATATPTGGGAGATGLPTPVQAGAGNGPTVRGGELPRTATPLEMTTLLGLSLVWLGVVLLFIAARKPRRSYA